MKEGILSGKRNIGPVGWSLFWQVIICVTNSRLVF